MIVLIPLLACGGAGRAPVDQHPVRDDTAAVEDDLPVSFLFINEFMASNQQTIQDDQGDWPDWVELYNASDQPVDLAGWTISDDLDQPDAHALDGLGIDAWGYLLLWADSDPGAGPQHLGFHLDLSGDSLGLFDPEGGTVDALSFGTQATDVSNARVPDAGSRWEICAQPSPESSNGGA